jgi:hypothetical protein
LVTVDTEVLRKPARQFTIGRCGPYTQRRTKNYERDYN